jgi:hypothetical protein
MQHYRNRGMPWWRGQSPQERHDYYQMFFYRADFFDAAGASNQAE